MQATWKSGINKSLADSHASIALALLSCCRVDKSCVVTWLVKVYSVSLCLLWRSTCEVIPSISSLLHG